MSAKILITGLANTGKTTLVKSLNNALVFSRDGKPFPFPIPHVNIDEWSKVEELLNTVQEKIEAYYAKFNKLPETLVFDSVSTIFTEIVINCTNKYENFKIWENVDKEISKFTSALHDLQVQHGFNIVLISHIVFEPEAKRYVEVTAGKFGKKGGFLAVVDYALTIDVVGKKYIITHK